jgi:hypothetical protein
VYCGGNQTQGLWHAEQAECHSATSAVLLFRFINEEFSILFGWILLHSALGYIKIIKFTIIDGTKFSNLVKMEEFL